MADAIVVGGSIAGLATALALSSAGYHVRVLERAAPLPTGQLDRLCGTGTGRPCHRQFTPTL
ncbi:NAD(P)-binding protein [Streptomyces sp. NPDC048516]|uniref:NAD(P)-binding protein n=1 Tax=Streptomyces sp. NPDC048516 TaxID=3365565 RepID=UPI00371F67B5